MDHMIAQMIAQMMIGNMMIDAGNNNDVDHVAQAELVVSRMLQKGESMEDSVAVVFEEWKT